MALRKELGLRDLVLFNIAALISTRWIGIAAHVGPGTIVLWMLAAAFLLVPCAFVVANLSRKFPEEGGLYIWTREAFGEWHAFACGWFYYISNVFWIPWRSSCRHWNDDLRLQSKIPKNGGGSAIYFARAPSLS